MKELIIASLLDEWQFVAIWLISPILLIGIYEILFNVCRTDTVLDVVFNKSESDIKIKSSAASKVLISLFSGFLVAYIFLIFYKEDFAYYDHFQFTSYSLISKPFLMPIWEESGRFWPLGLQEYNFLALLGKNELVYRSFSVFQLLILLFVVSRMLAKFPRWYMLAIMMLIMITQSFVTPFFELIYPERNLIFWLAILLFLSQRFLEDKGSRSRFYLYGALISSQFCLYYKETSFVLIGSFASARLIFGILENARKNKKLLKQFNSISFLKENYLEIGLMTLSAIFVILYWVMIKPYIVSEYKNYHSSPLLAFTSYIQNDFLLSVFLMVFALRVIYLIFNRKTPDLFWDALAIGAIMYFLAFVKLGMSSDYYIAPVDFVITLYLSHIFYWFFTDIRLKDLRVGKFTSLAIVVAIVCLIFNQNLQMSSFKVLHRKGVITGNVLLTNAIKQYAESSEENVATLFFPPSNVLYPAPYLIANFSSFLEYKGVGLYYGNEYPLPEKNHNPTETSEESPGETTFVLTTTEKFKDNQCVNFLPFKCFQETVPKTGDLIVFLPGGKETVEAMELKAKSRALFSYEYQPNLTVVERILLALSRQDYDFSDLNVYLHKL